MLIAFRDGLSVLYSGAHTPIPGLLLSLRTMQRSSLQAVTHLFLLKGPIRTRTLGKSELGKNVKLDACWFSHTQKVK